MMSQRLITVPEAARLLNISESCLRTRIQRGKYETERINGVLHVAMPDDSVINHDETEINHSAELDRSELRQRIAILETENAYLKMENQRLQLKCDRWEDQVIGTLNKATQIIDHQQQIELANHMKSIPAIDNTEAKQPKKKWWRFGK